jgi:hypothetical protein
MGYSQDIVLGGMRKGTSCTEQANHDSRDRGSRGGEETTGAKDPGWMASCQGAPVVKGGVDGAYCRVSGG